MKRAPSFVAVLIASCTPPPAPPPIVSIPIASAAPIASGAGPTMTTVPPPPRSARVVEGYPDPVASSADGCAFRGDWESAQPRTVRFRPEGKPIATIELATTAELALPRQTQEGVRFAFVELASDKVRAWGYVDGAALVLHAARPFLVAGYVAPGPRLPLKWTGSTGGRVAIEVAPPSFVAPVRAIASEVACADLTLAHPQFFARDAVVEPTQSTALLPPGRRIALREEPGGALVAQLAYERGTEPLVDVVARSGAQTRVVIHDMTLNPAWDMLLVGWVDTSALNPHTRGAGGSWATGGLQSSRNVRSVKLVTCDREVPFAAELEGEAHLVGVLAPKVPIDISGDGDGDDVNVRLDAAQVQPGEGVRFFVKRHAILGCTDPR